MQIETDFGFLAADDMGIKDACVDMIVVSLRGVLLKRKTLVRAALIRFTPLLRSNSRG